MVNIITKTIIDPKTKKSYTETRKEDNNGKIISLITTKSGSPVELIQKGVNDTASTGKNISLGQNVLKLTSSNKNALGGTYTGGDYLDYGTGNTTPLGVTILDSNTPNNDWISNQLLELAKQNNSLFKELDNVSDRLNNNPFNFTIGNDTTKEDMSNWAKEASQDYFKNNLIEPTSVWETLFGKNSQNNTKDTMLWVLGGIAGAFLLTNILRR